MTWPFVLKRRPTRAHQDLSCSASDVFVFVFQHVDRHAAVLQQLCSGTPIVCYKECFEVQLKEHTMSNVEERDTSHQILQKVTGSSVVRRDQACCPSQMNELTSYSLLVIKGWPDSIN